MPDLYDLQYIFAIDPFLILSKDILLVGYKKGFRQFPWTLQGTVNNFSAYSMVDSVHNFSITTKNSTIIVYGNFTATFSAYQA